MRFLSDKIKTWRAEARRYESKKAPGRNQASTKSRELS
jgi:hypothetical protein